MADLFLHIPKTGGMTLTTALKWIYGPASCYHLPSDAPLHSDLLIETLSRHRIQTSDLVAGHALYGLHRHLDCSCRYFTLLRDPVRRVVSHYFYHKTRYPDSSLAALSLTKFLQSDHPIAHSNRQVRFVSGKDPEQSSSAALDVAKKRLTNDFAAFGLTERFDESLIFFQTRLNWQYPPFYVRRKVNRSRPSVDELPTGTIEAIRQHNQLDAELYRFAQQQFEQMLNANVSDLEETLSRFRHWNRRVQTVAPPLLWLYRMGRRLLGKLEGAKS